MLRHGLTGRYGRIAMAHEPISTAIGLTSLLTSAFGATIFGMSAGSFGGLIIGLGLASGASYFMSPSMPNMGDGGGLDSGINDLSVRLSTRQQVPAKRIPYGYAKVGGPLFFEAVKGAYLTHGHLLSARPITSIEKMWIGINEILFEDFSENAILSPLPRPDVTDFPDYANNLRLSLRYGAANQAIDPLLRQDYTNLSNEFRQRGIATGVVRYAFGADYEAHQRLWGNGQAPTALWLVKGVKVPDPRRAGHRLDWDPTDPEDFADAEATWGWSNTAALVQADYLCANYGGRIAPSKIDWDKVAVEADYDEELIGCLDKTFIKRHALDGVVTMDQTPSSVMRGMLASNRGLVLQSGRKVWVSSSRPRTPVLTIYDDLLTAGIEFRAAKPKKELINRMRSRFVSAQHNYEQVDGPLRERTDWQADDGEILTQTYEAPFVSDHRQVQRLQKAALESARLGKTLVVFVNVGALAQADDELVNAAVVVDSAIAPMANGTYRITAYGYADNYASLELHLAEYDPAIERDWRASRDEVPFTIAGPDVS